MDIAKLCMMLTDVIQAAQTNKGLPNNEFAKRLGVSSRQIRRVYAGHPPYSIGMLLKIEEELGIQIFNITDRPSFTKTKYMPINKESFEFTTRIFKWCMDNGVKDISKMQDLFDLILEGMEGKAPGESNDKNLGAKYKSLRLGRGLSLKNLAKATGLSASAVSRIEIEGSAPEHVVKTLNGFYGI